MDYPATGVARVQPTIRACYSAPRFVGSSRRATLAFGVLILILLGSPDSPADAAPLSAGLGVGARRLADRERRVGSRRAHLRALGAARWIQLRGSGVDVAGRVVRELVGATLPAGVHSAEWDGADMRGHRVASRVYFYRLEAGGKALTRSLAVVE